MRIVPPHNSVLSNADTFVRDDFCQFKLRVWVWNSRRQQPRTQTHTCTQMSSGSRFNSSQARLSVSVRESDCLPIPNDSWHTHTHTHSYRWGAFTETHIKSKDSMTIYELTFEERKQFFFFQRFERRVKPWLSSFFHSWQPFPAEPSISFYLHHVSNTFIRYICIRQC